MAQWVFLRSTLPITPSTGIKYLLPTLSDAGRGDVALMIAQARTPPTPLALVCCASRAPK